MKIFKNKFFLICLCIAVVLCALSSTFAIMGYSGLAKNIVGTVTVPFRWVATKVGDAFEGFGRYFSSVGALQDENDSLLDENASLSREIEEAKVLEAENARLRSYLGMKQKFPSFTFEEGLIISYSSGTYVTSFTINRGSMHGIKTNMPVVTVDGIVGYVTEVGLNWCTVSTVIETATSVGAYVPRSGAVGIVSGDYSIHFDGLCKISYVDAGSDIKEGDLLYSSGTGSVYPADLPIGTVTEIHLDEYSRTLVGTVKPSVDFSSLKWVMVITGFENEAPEPDEESEVVR